MHPDIFCKRRYLFIRLRLPSTRKWRFRAQKTQVFENGSQDVDE